MPTHLEEIQLSAKAQDLITKLEPLLETHAQYRSAANMTYFDECVPSEDIEKQLVELGEEVVKSMTKGTTSCGIARPKNEGGWLINPHEQCLISLRVAQTSSAYVSDGKINIPFPRGRAIYCVPNRNVFVGGAEFACLHWAPK